MSRHAVIRSPPWPVPATDSPGAIHVALLREVGQAMRDASICGLGQTAWNAVESAIDRLGVFGQAEKGVRS
ncbi:putative respiratory chain oxidoreductase [Streptomyces sparsogenes DSM 40356]|uniref:Putative respiratory chain oxidoreductase n=1 Tax=Streptomyces sparsogenes DSM 40356 TaxID=1331668 RepID=A0A1R1SSN8_9ACTN|nr:putative respiratory chain oxidoreductase [Streptomyces sparsogenes DSM 40356]